MKRIIWLLVLIAAGYGVWKYYPELERQARSRTEAPPEEVPTGDAADLLIKGLPGATGPPTRTRAAAAPAPGVTILDGKAASTEEIELARRYPLPEFKPIEALVGEWKKIPASAFPREVTLKVPATLQVAGGAGTSTLEAGRKVVALAGNAAGTLVIAPSQDAVMRGTVPMGATDFQAVLGAVYDEFKSRKRAEVQKLRDAARKEAGAGSPALAAVLAGEGQPPPPAVLAKIGTRPPQREDHTIAAVEASIAERQKSRKHAEPPAGAVLGWSPLRYREVEGEPYWAASVRYTARTIFGEFPTEAVALIRHGRVVRWMYAGTGEPLP